MQEGEKMTKRILYENARSNARRDLVQRSQEI
jgi:hypothetical protein